MKKVKKLILKCAKRWSEQDKQDNCLFTKNNYYSSDFKERFTMSDEYFQIKNILEDKFDDHEILLINMFLDEYLRLSK